MEEVNNGVLHSCPLERAFDTYLSEARATAQKIDSMHLTMQTLFTSLSNLNCLPEIAISTSRQEGLLREMKEGLLAPAIGRDQVPTAVAENMLDRQQKSFHLIYRIMGGVIGVLILTISTILTGQKLGWFGAFH